MRPAAEVEVYLCREVVDFRKSINGLSILVEEQLGLSPFGPQLFVFCNRKRDKLKIFDLFRLQPHEALSYKSVA